MSAPLEPSMLDIVQGIGSIGTTGMTGVVGFFLWWFNKKQNQDREDRLKVETRLTEVENRQFNELTTIVTDAKVAVLSSSSVIDRNSLALNRVAEVIERCGGSANGV